jgi:hypothetical protein
MKWINRLHATAVVLLFSIAATRVTSEETKAAVSYVPNAEAAIEIALKVWIPIYGEKLIASEKPYQANLHNGVWTVKGSLPQGRIGGTAHVEISEADGKVVKYWHEQ